MRKIKTGDEVKIMAGDFKGTTGKVQKVDTKKDRVVVDGVKKMQRFVRKNLMGSDNPGTVMEIDRWIHISNVMVICPKSKKPSRVGFAKKGKKKTRVTKKGGVKLDWKEN